MSIPVYRDCPYDMRYKNLCKSWGYSAQRLKSISIELQKQISCEKTAIMVAGSYGRYEAGQPSDLDFFIISMPDATAKGTMNAVSSTAENLGIKLPNNDGVFSEIIAYDNILNKLGNQDESTNELAQRLLPLMESTPIFNSELCEKITSEILFKYMDLHRDAPDKEAVILLNDLIRFFRYICANYQYKSWHDGEKWVLRNIKLRHSRVVMYAGLLFVILNASKDEYRLADDGAIFISIDDTECANLKAICDEIFGNNCFVSNISWQRTYSTRNDSKGIVNEVEHVLVYSKQTDWSPNKLPRTEAMDSIYKNPDNDIKLWASDNPFAPGAATHQGMVYAIQHPFTGKMLYPR